MTLKELYKTADYKDSHGMLFHGDCLEIMKNIEDKTADFVLTDIPYAEVNRSSNGLRNLDKGNADVLTFNLYSFFRRTLSHYFQFNLRILRKRAVFYYLFLLRK